MSFLLKRVELSNVRAHEHLVFEPDSSGVTGIRGQRGAGKSTILNSVAWALYGIKFPGVTKNSDVFRSGADVDNDKCFVEIDLSVDDSTLKIRRSMTAKGSAKCVVVSVDDDGNESEILAGPAVSHAEKYIRQRLKTTKQDFLASVFVRQKEVDGLVLADAKKRGEVIEELTGVSSLTKSLEEAKGELREIKAAVKLSSVDSKTLEELHESRKAVADDLNKRKKTVESLEGKSETIRERVQKSRDRYEDYSKRRDLLDKVEYKLSVIDPSLESAQKEHDELVDERTELKPQLDGFSSSAFREVEEQRKGLEKSLKDANVKLSALNNQLTELKDSKSANGAIVRDSGHDSLQSVDSHIVSIRGRVTELENSIAEIKERAESIKAENRSLRTAYASIDDGDGKCTTCLQAVENASETLRSLRETVDGNKAELNKLKSQSDGEKSDLESLNKQLEELDRVRSAFVDADGVDGKIENTKSEIKALESDIIADESEKEAVDKMFYSAHEGKKLRERYETVRSRLESLSDRLETLKKDRRKMEKIQSETDDIKQSSVDTARERLQSAEETEQSIARKLEANKSEVAVLTERLGNVDENIKSEEANAEKYRELLKKSEHLATVIETLSEFRQNRVDNAVPAIEALASDLLTRFTEGSMVNVVLDSSFRVRVILADGTERALGLLSGGELSAVAMALRLAISLMLNSNSSNSTILLDEVLVSQDVEGSELMLNTIKDVCKGQVVMIAHNANMESIVDKTIHL